MDARRRLGRRGQAMVEFALVLPLLVVLVAGFFDVAVLLYSRICVDAAVHAALAAAQSGGRPGLEQAAVAASVASRAVGVRVRPEDVTVERRPDARPGWERVVVTVRFAYSSTVWLFLSRDRMVRQVVRHERLLAPEVLQP